MDPRSTTRYWDEKEQAYYYHCSASGESSWEPPSGFYDDDDDADNESLIRRHRVRVDVEDEADDVSEDEAILAESRADVQAQQVREATESTLRLFACCFFFHGCCCEAPCAGLEALCRGPCYLATAAVLAFFRAKLARRYAREGLIFLALALSLLLMPPLICCAYAGFDPDAEHWALRPIPTPIGCVDARRLFVVAFGQGADAANVAEGTTSMDAWTGSILHLPHATLNRICRYLRSPLSSNRTEKVSHSELAGSRKSNFQVETYFQDRGLLAV